MTEEEKQKELTLFRHIIGSDISDEAAEKAINYLNKRLEGYLERIYSKKDQALIKANQEFNKRENILFLPRFLAIIIEPLSVLGILILLLVLVTLMDICIL